MPLLLRQIRKSRWYSYPNGLASNRDTIPADSLADLQTSGNKLSVWKIEENETALKRITAALAANRDRPANFDYALFDWQWLTHLEIQTCDRPGETPDEIANTWHLDLIALSADKLVLVAEVIRREGRINRISEKETRQLLLAGLNSDRIARAKLKDSMLRSLE